MSSSTTTAEQLVATTMSNIKGTMLNLITTTTPQATKIDSTTTSTTTTSTSSPTSSAMPSVSSTASHHEDGEKILNVSDLSTSMQHFGVMDYCVFVLMLIVCAGIGFYFGFIEKKKKKQPNMEKRRGSEALDYLVGGRKMKVFPVSLSLVASFVSGISLLGTSTEIYVYGTQYAFILVTLALSGVISWYIFLPVFCNLQLTSTYEYLEMRFDRRLRLFGSIMFLVGMILWLPISIYVPALTFNQVTGINLYTIIPIVCVVCTIYTCIGGIKGVIWTDVLQGFVMVGSLVFVAIKGTMDVGGVVEVYDRNKESGRLVAPEWTFDPTVRMGFFAVFVGGTLLKLQGTCILQPAVQRFLSLPNMVAVKKSLYAFIIGLVCLLSLCIYLGLLAFASYYDCDPISTGLVRAKDQIVPLYVMQIAGSFPGVGGLFVSGVFSAALSSLSTVLNSLSGVVLKDFVEPYRKKPFTERQTAIILRVVVLFFGVSAMALVKVVEKLGMVMQLSATVNSISTGPMLGVFTVGMTMPFVKTESVLTGCTTAALTMAYVAIRSQIDSATGVLKFPTKPVSVEGCTYEFEALNKTILSTPIPETSGSAFHHLSFLWYTGLGASITIVVALLATLYFGKQDSAEVDPKLITPILRKYMNKYKYSSVAMNINELDTELQDTYLEMRFDRRLRLFGSVMFLFGAMLWLPISIYVPALTFNQVTGINLYTIIPVVCLVCTIYTCIGGIKGVIWTDVLQGFIMVGSLAFVSIKGTIDVGGLGTVYQRNMESGRLVAPEWTFDPTVRMGFFAVFVGGTLLKLQGTCINQPAVQRFLSLGNMADVKKSLYAFIIGLVCLLGLCIYLGLLAFASYYDCDPISTGLVHAKDQIVPLYVMQIAGAFPGIAGLFVSGVFSAALSSLSTCLNSLSGVVLKDFVEPYRSQPFTERQTAIFLRAVVLIFGVSAMGLVKIVEKLGMVMQLSATVNSISIGPILGIFTVGMTMPFVKAKSVLTGCITSALFMAYIAIRSQIDSAMGVLKFPTKPVSIEGCTYEFEALNKTILSTTEPSSESAPLHHVSFLWYSAIGAVITITVSLLSTLFYGRQDSSEVDPKLITPVLRKYMNKYKYSSVAMNMNDIQADLEKPLMLNLETFCCTNFYFEKRFSRRMRLFGAALFNLKTVLWLPIAVYVPALTFSQVSGIDIHTIAPMVIVICTFYTCVGGIKGVVWTDVIQSIIMFASMIVLMIKGTIDLGGLQVLWQRNLDGGRLNFPDITLDPTVRMSVLSVFVGGTFFKLQNTSINQPTIQRFMSLPNIHKIKQTLYTFSIGLTLLYMVCIYVGLLAYATYYDCDPMATGLAPARDQLVPLLVMDVLGKFPGMPGLFVAGVFSAALSSLSTYLNSLAAVTLEDLVKPYWKRDLSERATAIILRSVVIVFGLSSICLVYVVEKLGMVLQLSATLQSIVYGPMLGIFTVGMLMPWINEKSVLTGSIVAFLSMAWICINAQIANVTGTFRHPKLPISIEGCDYDLPSQGTAIYHVSFLLYTGLGACIVLVASNVAALYFGFMDVHKVDEKVLAPWVARFLKKYKYSEVELKEFEADNTK
ncbi:Sodium-coupled monocarboxylate transporter 1 [Lucilia cuprina]|nr:Sodium-coupled monocarboxylate transporter 1 [Lucilia cuprina]